MESSKDQTEKLPDIKTNIIGKMIAFSKNKKAGTFANFFNDKNSELKKIDEFFEKFSEKIKKENLTVTTESAIYLELIKQLKELDPDNDEAKFLVLQSQFALIHSKDINLDIEWNKYKIDKKSYTGKIIYADLLEKLPLLSKEISEKINNIEDPISSEEAELMKFQELFKEYNEDRKSNIYDKLEILMRKVSKFQPKYELTQDFKNKIEDTMIIKNVRFEIITQENNNNNNGPSNFAGKHKMGGRGG